MTLMNRLPLRLLLTLPYVALVLGIAVLIGALSYRAGSQAVDTVADHLLLETVARIGQAVDRHVVGSAAVLEAAFPNGMAAPASIGSEFEALRTRFWIATSLHLDPNNYVYYGNRQGQFFGLWRESLNDGELRVKLRSDEARSISHFSGIRGPLSTPVPEQRMFDPRQRPWYVAGIGSQSLTWTSIYIDFRTAELVATRARRVLDGSGQLEGVVATDLSLRRLNDFVRSLKVSRHAVAFIIEPDGKLIASSGGDNVRRQPDGSNARVNAADSGHALQVAAYEQVRAAAARPGGLDAARTLRFDGPDGRSVQLAYDRLQDSAGLDWITVVAVPSSDFMQGVTENVLRTALIGAAAALIAVSLGLGIFGWVGRDLRRLAQAAKAVGEGRFDVPLEVHRRDEIGALATSFRQMQHKLHTDTLTGLMNREVIVRAIDQRLRSHRRAGDSKPFAVLFIDLNRFKLINDRLGHDAGDRALVEVGARLRASTRSADLVARYAGDEFVVLLDNIDSPAAADQIRLHLEAVLREPLTNLGADEAKADLAGVMHGGAVGVALYPGSADSADDLIRQADRDMYERKRAAR